RHLGGPAGDPRAQPDGPAHRRRRRSRRGRPSRRAGDRVGGANVTTETAAKTAIVFGTDGWRSRIAEDFTFDNVRRCADGVARYVLCRGEREKGVGMAYDRRFASERFAAAAADVLAGQANPAAFAALACPTLMSPFEVAERVA